MITMSQPKIVWIVQLDKEMKEFFDDLAEKEGDKAYGNGARYVKKVLSDFIRKYQNKTDTARPPLNRGLE